MGMYHTDFNSNTTTTTKNAACSSSPPQQSKSGASSARSHCCWDECLFPFPVTTVWGSLAVFALGVLCFCSSVRGDFVFDDSEAVVNNVDLRPSQPIGNILLNDFWGTRLTHSASHKSWRPLTVLTFRWSYWAADGLDPFAFHLVNVVLHGLVCALVFQSVARLFDSSCCVEGGRRAAFASALLFAVHPVHAESVAAVVGRADLLCAVFFLSSFLCYHKARRLDAINGSTCAWVGFALLLAAMSMLSKEQGITVIGVCSAYDLCRLDLWDVVSKRGRSKKLISLVIRHAMLSLGGAALLMTRWQVMDSQPPSFQPVDNPASFVQDFHLRILNYNYIYALNAWLLLLPWWLCFDWSMGCIPLIDSVWDVRLLAVFGLWSAAISFAYVCLGVGRNNRLPTMCLALLVIPFLPASNVFFRVGFVIAERVLYLPSIGFCCLVVVGLVRVASNWPSLTGKLRWAFVFLLVVFVMRSMHRCTKWHNEQILFNSGLDVCPLNAKVRYNIAKNCADRGLRDEAIKGYREAIKLNSQYDQAMNNLANMLKDSGELEEAERLLVEAIQIRPDFAAAWMNLGIVEAGLGKWERAENSYRTAIQHRRRYPDCYYNLGNLYLEQKRHDEAYRAWRNATSLRPTQLVAWNNMIVMLDSIGQLEKAERVAFEALAVLPDEATLHFNLANTLGKMSKFKQSESHFEKAISLNANNPVYYTNLGVLYHLWGKLDDAQRAYQEALRIRPDMKRAIDNLHLVSKARLKTNLVPN